MTERAEWVIGEPDHFGGRWRVIIWDESDPNRRMVGEVRGNSKEECCRRAALFRASEAMKDLIQALAAECEEVAAMGGQVDISKGEARTWASVARRCRAALRLATPQEE